MAFSTHEKQNCGTSDLWLTPLSIIHSLGGFDLDPCGFSFWPTAAEIFENDGLEKPWHGRVWLNPPYSEVELWLERLAMHGYGISLVFARTDTKWFQYIVEKADSVFFPAGRIQFVKIDGSTGNAGAPSAFLSFGERPKWPMRGFKAK